MSHRVCSVHHSVQYLVPQLVVLAEVLRILLQIAHVKSSLRAHDAHEPEGALDRVCFQLCKCCPKGCRTWMGKRLVKFLKRFGPIALNALMLLSTQSAYHRTRAMLRQFVAAYTVRTHPGWRIAQDGARSAAPPKEGGGRLQG